MLGQFVGYKNGWWYGHGSGRDGHGSGRDGPSSGRDCCCGAGAGGCGCCCRVHHQPAAQRWNVFQGLNLSDSSRSELGRVKFCLNQTSIFQNE